MFSSVTGKSLLFRFSVNCANTELLRVNSSLRVHSGIWWISAEMRSSFNNCRNLYSDGFSYPAEFTLKLLQRKFVSDRISKRERERFFRDIPVTIRLIRFAQKDT